MKKSYKKIFGFWIVIGIILISAPLYADSFLPKYVQYTLPNGMEVYLVEDHCLPMIHARLIFKNGASSDSSSLAGLSYITMELLTKGTKKYPAEILNSMIDSTGGNIYSLVSYDVCGIYGDFLARDLDFSMEVISEMVISPKFTETTLDNLRRRVLSNIIREQGLTLKFMSLLLIGEIYGEEGYGLPIEGTFESISDIEIDQLEMYYKQNICPNNAVLILSGDFKNDTASKLIKDKFSKWSKSEKIIAPKPKGITPDQTRIIIIDEPNAEISEFVIGRDVENLKSESGVALQILNYLLGGSGSISILSQRLLTEYILVTDIKSEIIWKKESGTFKLSGSANHINLAEAVEKSLAEMEFLTELKLPLNEISDAKNYHKNIYASVFEGSESTANQFVEFIRMGLNPDFYYKYLERIDKITPNDLRECARKYFKRENMVIVVSGPASIIKPGLSNLGSVELIKMSRN
ncbi:MAG: pitrilysin family protein [Candidatus Zixiibacteriota bacterium]